MGNGNKKNKRGSIPSSTVTTPKTELIERTPDNDYGVLSDPDENAPSTPVPLLTKEAESEAEAEAEASQDATHQQPPATLEMKKDEVDPQSQPTDDIVCSHTPSDPSPTSNSQQSPSPSLQEQSPSLQPQTQETQSSKSLVALQLKLSKDKNFSRKITLHTFFSYIILAIELQRASSTSMAQTLPEEVQKLIEYMIEHHCVSDAVRNYLHSLIELGVIKNLIEAIIDFNKDQTDALDKLLTEEQLILEMNSIKDTAVTATDVNVTTTTSDQTPANQSPQTSQRRTSFFKRLGCFLSGCCG